MLTDVRRTRLTLPETGVEIALLDWGGDGPLAVLHHANGFCGAMWGLVAEALRPHFRVVAMDARGHGDSSRPEGADAYGWENFGRDLAAVADHLAAAHPEGRVALGLGHSFGATATLMAAAAKPNLFERVVLVDPITHPPVTPEYAAARRTHTEPLAEGARRRRHHFSSREEARASWEGKSFFADWDPRALDLYLAEGLRDREDGGVELKCAGAVEAAIFESGASFDSWSVAARVTAPARILWAVRGNFPRELYERLAEQMPNARVEDADAGHLVPMERPEVVVESVLRFCAER